LALAVAVVALIGLAGCSDDTQRVSVLGSSNPIEPADGLTTGTDDFDSYSAYYDYISEGFYYPDEGTDQGEVFDPNTHDNDDDPPNKPIDNGLENY
jgi:hypothetical protein